MDWYDESDVWRRGISSNADWGITPQINYFSFFTAIFRCHGCLFIHILYTFCRKKCTRIWNQTHKVYVNVVRYRWAPAGSVHYFQNMLNQGFTVLLFFFCWRYNPLWVCILQPFSGAIAPSLTRFLDHTWHATIGRTALDEWSVRHRDLYLTTHSTNNRQTSVPPVGFEPTISAGERP